MDPTWTEAALDRADHLRAEHRERPVATVARIADGYYVLRLSGREIGGTNRSAMERYARKKGHSTVCIDERKPELRSKPL